MSYIGNTPTQQNFVAGADQFSGNGSTTAFTLSRNVNTVFDIFVAISNVPQDPYSAYSVSGNTLTFTSAPPSGTGNIYVVYRATNVQTFVPTPGVSASFGDVTYTGTLTGSTGVVNIGSGQLYKDTSGNVGIGTSSPGFKLEVVGGTNNGVHIKDAASATVFGGLFTQSASLGLYARSNHALTFGTNDTERMRIDSSGNVGIGTSSPLSTAMLEVSRSTTVLPTATVTADNQVTGWRTRRTGGSYAYEYYMGIRENSTALDFYDNTANALRARIDSSGNVYIGTSAQAVNTYLLTLRYSGNAQKGGIMFDDTDSGHTYEACYFRKDGTQRGYIRVTSTGTTYATVSDYRLKENVQPMTGALAKIAALKPCTYTWKDSDVSGQGFIAHELQAVVPDCVTGEKDAVDENGNPKYQGIDTSFLVATLTAAIQELNAKVEAQAAEIAALKGAA